MHRDGYRLDEAGEKLLTARRTALSDAELARLLTRLPLRAPLRPMEVPPDPVLSAAETGEQRGQILGALERVLERMEPEDRLVALMHWVEGRTVADVARALGLEQKPLYRRVNRLRMRLLEELEGEGVGAAQYRAAPRTAGVWQRARPTKRPWPVAGTPTPEQIVRMAYYLEARKGFATDSEMARAFGVHKSRISGWKQGQAADEGNAWLLRDLAAAVSRLADHYPQDTIGKWLSAANPDLEGRPPMELLREGRLAEVLMTIEAQTGGAYL